MYCLWKVQALENMGSTRAAVNFHTESNGVSCIPSVCYRHTSGCFVFVHLPEPVLPVHAARA